MCNQISRRRDGGRKKIWTNKWPKFFQIFPNYEHYNKKILPNLMLSLDSQILEVQQAPTRETWRKSDPSHITMKFGDKDKRFKPARR